MKRNYQETRKEDRPRKIRFVEDEDNTVLHFSDPVVEKRQTDQKLITPWLSEETRTIDDTMLRLQSEIIEFTNYIAPTEQQHKIRSEAFEHVKRVIKSNYDEEIKIKIFGSFHTRTYLPNADIDIVVIINGFEQKEAYKKLEKILRGNPDTFSSVLCIPNANVPIIKFVYNKNNLHFDISVNKLSGIQQVKQAKKALKQYPEMRYLILINKLMLKQRELSETYKGGVGSFLLFSMILYFLRECKRMRRNFLLSQYLLMFFEFYGERTWSDKKILVKEHQIVYREPDRNEFSLISPLDQNQDIGAKAYHLKSILAVYKNRFRLLSNYNFKKGESILKYLVNPNEQVFCFLKE